MAEVAVTATERHPLAGLGLPKRLRGVHVADAGCLARFVIRGERAGVATAIGIELPGEPCRSAHTGTRAALWLGPDEWLLLAPRAEHAILAGAVSRLRGGASGCAVDVSHRNAGLVVEGRTATDVLSAGCPLDLAMPAFPIGMCTRTLFGKAEIVMWRTGDDAFRIEVWRSFAPYVVALLGEAMRDAA